VEPREKIRFKPPQDIRGRGFGQAALDMERPLWLRSKRKLNLGFVFSRKTVIEVAITKRVELHPLEGAIITSSLGFQARSNILKSLLALDAGEQSEAAIKVVTAAADDANRNMIIHGQVFAEGESLTFVFRKTGHTFTAKKITLDSDAMREKAGRLKDHVVKLQSLLSISDDDLHEFGKIGMIAASKP
jgi:hypothetical protein